MRERERERESNLLTIVHVQYTIWCFNFEELNFRCFCG